MCPCDGSDGLQVTDIQSNAQFILLVEKDAAFMRLAEDRFYNTYPCIILTAKGQPDVATRQAAHFECPHLSPACMTLDLFLPILAQLAWSLRV